ncbi:MAG: ABC transporter ATP-binding protein [Planctomycetaceae bacterium]
MLTFSDVDFGYASGNRTVLNVARLNIPEGQFVSLLGASGSGKSTLLRLIAGLLKPSAGVLANEALESGVAGAIGMVFQNPNLVPWRSAEGNVTLPAELGPKPSNISPDTIRELFQLVGLRPEHRRRQATELSGGMQMRVSLARSLVLKPALLLLDEPFAALDDLLRMQLEQDVRDIHNRQQLTSVLVTHNISEAVFMSDRVLVLGGEPAEIFADLPIPLPPERNRQLRTSGEFHQLYDQVTEALHSAASPPVDGRQHNASAVAK